MRGGVGGKGGQQAGQLRSARKPDRPLFRVERECSLETGECLHVML